MAVLKSRKLQASTILEVLISLVIIMIVFSMAIGIYAKVTGSNFSFKTRSVHQELFRILADTKEENDFSEKDTTIDNTRYSRKGSAYKNFKDLIQVEIIAEQNGGVIDSLKAIVNVKQDYGLK